MTRMEIINSSVKIERELFVTGHVGTTLSEATLIICFPSILVLLRVVIWEYLPFTKFDVFRFFYDILILVGPFLAGITIFSDLLFYFVSLIAVFTFTIIFLKVNNVKSSKNLSYKAVQSQQIKDLLLSSSHIPFITSFIFVMHMMTMICILAVDFNVFPRRFAKTETFGCSLMDLGVGTFIFINGLISSFSKVSCEIKSKKIFLKQLKGTIPLTILGLIRYFSIKATGYQQHISEYGFHWNFFFTISVVKVMAELIISTVKVKNLCFVTFGLITSYQFFLKSPYFDFTSLILDNNRRETFLMQNKEGIFSSVGFLSIYFIGILHGIYIFKNKQNILEWTKLGIKMLCFSIFCFIFLLLSIHYIQNISRRMANLSYVVWITSQCSLLLALLLMFDIILVYLIFQGSLPSYSMPNRWVVSPKFQRLKAGSYFQIKCLMCAVNRNQLFMFLLSNIFTGLFNFLFNTLHTSTFFSLIILSFYSTSVLGIIWILHTTNFTLKFW